MSENQFHNISAQKDVSVRLKQMQGQLRDMGYRFLNQKYLAKKLNRTEGAISQALNGYPHYDELRMRIVRHLVWVEEAYLNNKKVA